MVLRKMIRKKLTAKLKEVRAELYGGCGETRIFYRDLILPQTKWVWP
jgi:hypothetical protein